MWLLCEWTGAARITGSFVSGWLRERVDGALFRISLEAPWRVQDIDWHDRFLGSEKHGFGGAEEGTRAGVREGPRGGTRGQRWDWVPPGSGAGETGLWEQPKWVTRTGAGTKVAAGARRSWVALGEELAFPLPLSPENGGHRHIYTRRWLWAPRAMVPVSQHTARHKRGLFSLNRHLAPNLLSQLRSLFFPPPQAQALEAICSHTLAK